MRRFASRAPWSTLLVLTAPLVGSVSCGGRTPLSDLDAWNRETGGGHGDGDGDTSDDGAGGSRATGGAGGFGASGGSDTSGSSGGSGASGGSGGLPTTPEYVDEWGAPCERDGARACDRNVPRRALICEDGTWTEGEECSDDEACDPDAGRCASVLPECVGRERGDRFCDADDLMECGANLVRAHLVKECEGLCVTTSNSAQCAAASCGDGKRQSDEECDDGDDDNADECTELCRAPFCGDGFHASDEECDDGDNDNADECTELCRAPFCGDGFRQPGEDCDDANTNGRDNCSNTCQWTLQVATGSYFTCARRTDGTVACWGDNSYGQLGDGTIGVDRWTPLEVPGLSGVSLIALGGGHACALKDDDTVLCWGNNSYGQLGDGTTEERWTPTHVSGLSGVQGLALGGAHSCAVNGDGTVVCWGSNSVAQLGDGTTLDRLSPVEAPGLSGVRGLALGSGHSCVLEGDGTVACWGSNTSGQLGDGTITSRRSPTLVPGVSGVTDLAAGVSHNCALKSSGTLACWGGNGGGQLGTGSTDSNLNGATEVPGLFDGTDVAVGQAHSCVTRSDGSVWCWGSNTFGQLGVDSTGTHYSPERVVGLLDVTSVSLGYLHTCAVELDDTIWCWGLNTSGELGSDAGSIVKTPVAVQW